MAILGASNTISRLSSTGLDSSTALITSTNNIEIRLMGFTHDTVLSLDGTGVSNSKVNISGVSFLNCNSVGNVSNYNKFFMENSQLDNSNNLTFDGSFDSVEIVHSSINTTSNETGIIVPATCTISNLIDISSSEFNVSSTETGINVSSSATIPSEMYSLRDVRFFGGGTYVSGIDFNDARAEWKNNKGISNSKVVAHYYNNSSTTTVNVPAISTPIKINIPTISNSLSGRFTFQSNRATYTGIYKKLFKVTYYLRADSGSLHILGAYIFKNGVRVDPGVLFLETGTTEAGMNQALVELETDDYIEIWLENRTQAFPPTVRSISVIVEEVT